TGPSTLPSARAMTASAAPVALPVGRNASTISRPRFDYDGPYRVTKAGESEVPASATYGYDERGNRLSDAAPATYGYDAADRLQASGSSTTYDTDGNGNLKQRGADTFTYDQANHLKSATVSGTTTTYAYDG